jgi:hypothetical protein
MSVPNNIEAAVAGAAIWRECHSTTHNRKYWFNEATGDSVWVDPNTAEGRGCLHHLGWLYRNAFTFITCADKVAFEEKGGVENDGSAAERGAKRAKLDIPVAMETVQRPRAENGGWTRN